MGLRRNMCEFCCKIGKLEKIKQGAFRGGYYPEKMKHKLLNLKMHFIYFSDVVTLLCLELKSKI